MSSLPFFLCNINTPKPQKKFNKFLSIDTSSLGKVECSSMNSLSNFMNIICHELTKKSKASTSFHFVSHKNIVSSIGLNARSSFKAKLNDLYNEVNLTEQTEPRKRRQISNVDTLKYIKSRNKNSTLQLQYVNTNKEYKMNQIMKMINKNCDGNLTISTVSERRTKASEDLTEDI